VPLIWRWLCENWCLSTEAPKSAGARPSVVGCLGAAFCFSPPRGGAAAGWVGGTRGMPSGEIWGGNGPAAGALIGLTICHHISYIIISYAICDIRQDFVAEAGASRKSVGSWELFVRTQIEWGTRWWTRFGAVLGRLSVGRPYVCKWPFMARRYGRCCMYGPNYVKLSRVFAVQLFGMIIEHYAALRTPGPIRPPLVPQPCHHRLHSPRPDTTPPR
jgi:hypothetical protein